MLTWLQTHGAALACGVAVGVAAHSVVGGMLQGAWRVSPWSAESKLERARDKVEVLTGQLGTWKQAAAERMAAIQERDARMREYGAQAALDYGQAADRWAGQCSAAFNSGVAAGRAVAAAKGSSNAGSGVAPAAGAAGGGGAGVDAGGVRPSFRDAWADGAFVPKP